MERRYITPKVFMTDNGLWTDSPFEELNIYERYICQSLDCCTSVIPVLKKGKDIIYNDMLKKIFAFTKDGNLENGIYYEITVKEFHESNMLEKLKKENWEII